MKNELPLVSKLSDVGIKKFLNRGSVSDEIKERVKEIINNVKERKPKTIL